MRSSRLLLLAATTFAVTGCDSTSPEDEVLATIVAATSQYQNVDVALADGFEPASPCVETDAGGMGYHYANFARIDGTVDTTQPEILLYEPVPGGGLKLVGVEYMVAADAWAGASPPELAGATFAAHLTPETLHGIPFPHYDLHVWSVVDNPSGTFAPHNPDVSCAAAT